MVMRRTVVFGVLALVAGAAGAQNKPAVDKVAAPRTIASSGKQTYMQYCASCHGPDARGNGPAAFVLKTPPPDLTTLAKRHDGKFPYEYVYDVLRFGTRIVATARRTCLYGGQSLAPWITMMRSQCENASRISATT
jgi:hypothetical protein